MSEGEWRQQWPCIMGSDCLPFGHEAKVSAALNVIDTNAGGNATREPPNDHLGLVGGREWQFRCLSEVVVHLRCVNYRLAFWRSLRRTDTAAAFLTLSLLFSLPYVTITMSVNPKAKRLVLTGAVTFITIAGTLYGAGVKTEKEVSQVRTIRTSVLSWYLKANCIDPDCPKDPRGDIRRTNRLSPEYSGKPSGQEGAR